MSEQNTDTPIADNNSVTNDSTKADTNDNNIPKARLDEVVAQRHKVAEERDSLRAELDKIKANQESQRKQELEKQGEYKTLLEEQGKELEKYKADSNAWNDYKTNKRASLMENITNDDDKLIAEDLSLAKLEKFVGRVTQTNAVGTPNQRPANSTKGTGQYGGYSSWAEYAQKDPQGAEKAMKNLDNNYGFKTF
tara:strand:- start:4077 stop:4658 length:582 start_codon:yes stop_codon:yes gene_type:complete